MLLGSIFKIKPEFSTTSTMFSNVELSASHIKYKSNTLVYFYFVIKAEMLMHHETRKSIPFWGGGGLSDYILC